MECRQGKWYAIFTGKRVCIPEEVAQDCLYNGSLEPIREHLRRNGPNGDRTGREHRLRTEVAR